MYAVMISWTPISKLHERWKSPVTNKCNNLYYKGGKRVHLPSSTERNGPLSRGVEMVLLHSPTLLGRTQVTL